MPVRAFTTVHFCPSQIFRCSSSLILHCVPVWFVLTAAQLTVTSVQWTPRFLVFDEGRVDFVQALVSFNKAIRVRSPFAYSAVLDRAVDKGGVCPNGEAATVASPCVYAPSQIPLAHWDRIVISK